MKSVFYAAFLAICLLASGCATQSSDSHLPAGELRERLLGRWFVQQLVSKPESNPLFYEEAEFHADGTLVRTRVFRHPDYRPPRVDRLSDTTIWSLADGSLVEHHPASGRRPAFTTTSPIRILTTDKLVFASPNGAEITYLRRRKQVAIPRVP